MNARSMPGASACASPTSSITRPIMACNCIRAIAARRSSNSTTLTAATTFSVPYPPAGPDWQRSIRKDVTQALIGVEMESPEPQRLAEHWGRIIEIPVTQNQGGEPELRLPNCSFRFVEGASEMMSGLTFKVGDVAAVRDAAKARGLAVSGDSFVLGGVTFRLAA